MSDDIKNPRQHPEDPPKENPQLDENPVVSAKDLLRTDPQAAWEMLTRERRDRSHGDIQRPPRHDPRHTAHKIPPGQTNVPAGGTTGGGMGGGSSKRRTQE
ncbi:hypothetical protein [Sphaerobacter thermophilus]|jgi:hypothetical protein|uniref:hypothetical protein n=1 Tax=Sphaerobacter thermophilus TaxID=2057 RepID=UPI000DB46119|nr:MAG: hypothetical protein DIU58_17340 [Sphaerobacter thermophilus]